MEWNSISSNLSLYSVITDVSFVGYALANPRRPITQGTHDANHTPHVPRLRPDRFVGLAYNTQSYFDRRRGRQQISDRRHSHTLLRSYQTRRHSLAVKG